MAKSNQRIRAERSKPTSAAQAVCNQKLSLSGLELKLAANFNGKDHVLTFTYDDRHLPQDKNAGAVVFQKFIRDLRDVRRKRGEDLKYIFVTEGAHAQREEDGVLENERIHHHAVINAVGPGDLEELRSLWVFGGYLRSDQLEGCGCPALAGYLTREAREFGRQKSGEWTWRASRNLNHFRGKSTSWTS